MPPLPTKPAGPQLPTGPLYAVSADPNNAGVVYTLQFTATKPTPILDGKENQTPPLPTAPTTQPAPTGPIWGVSTDPNNAGVLGEGPTGVYGRNTDGMGNGVIGYSENGRGVWGHSHSSGIGVLGESANGNGVQGYSAKSYGVRGHSDSIAGIRGSSNLSRGVEGWAKNSEGVLGISETSTGVLGQSTTGVGVWGKGPVAGVFEGDVKVTRDLKVDGDIKMTNADCAEDFDVSGSDRIEPGTVMVLGHDGTVCESSVAYDKRVAGVISGAGDYKPAIVLDTRTAGNRQPIALMGKVFCKVDAQYGEIEIGDLLTSSPTPGHAMKTGDPSMAFGAVIGKALRRMAEGRGLIPILIALQ